MGRFGPHYGAHYQRFSGHAAHTVFHSRPRLVPATVIQQPEKEKEKQIIYFQNVSISKLLFLDTNITKSKIVSVLNGLTRSRLVVESNNTSISKLSTILVNQTKSKLAHSEHNQSISKIECILTNKSKSKIDSITPRVLKNAELLLLLDMLE